MTKKLVTGFAGEGGGQRLLLLDVESTFCVGLENQFSCYNYPVMGAKITAERLLDKAKLQPVR